MKDLNQIIQNIKEYSESKQYILENVGNLTDEEIQHIIEQAAEEHNLTENQIEYILNELFGIGATVKGVAKRVGTAVATPFKKAAGFVKGVGQGIANVSKNLDAKAAAHQASKINVAKQKQKAEIKKSTTSGKKLVPGGITKKPVSSTTPPKTTKTTEPKPLTTKPKTKPKAVTSVTD